MTHSRRIVGHKSAAENAPVDQARCAAWLVRQHRLDGDPFLIGESAAHDSRPKVGNLESQPSRRLQPCEQSPGGRLAEQSGYLMLALRLTGYDPRQTSLMRW